MWYLGKVYHEHLVGDGLAECEWQLHLGLLELARVEYAEHRYDAGVGIWYLDTYCALAWHWRDDTYAEGSQAQCDVVFEVLYLRYSYSWLRCDLIEGDGRTDGCGDGVYFYSKVAQYADDSVLVGFLFVAVNVCLSVVLVPFQ